MEIKVKDADGIVKTVYVPDEQEQNELIEVVGQKSDSEATTDNGTFSIVSFFKRLLGYFTALLNRIPALVGGKIPVVAEFQANQQIQVSNFPNGLALDVTLGQLLTELQRKANLLQTQPVNVTNQISGFATQTTLNDLLTAVNFLAKLTDTQPVSVQNQISGFATDATLAQIKTVLDNIQAKIIASPATEAKQNDTITALNSILSELRDDISLSETVWTDDNNVYFVRQAIVNQDSGVITYAYILPNGTTYTPIGNIRLAGLEKDREVIQANFVANTNGIGYNTNDIVSRVDIIDVTASPFVNLAQIWFNRTQQTTISAPTAGHLNANPTQNISGNVGVTNQITGFSTETTLASLLTELEKKADLNETQPVEVANQIAGFSLEETQLLIKTVVDNILNKIIASPSTEAKQDNAITELQAIKTFFETKEVTEIPSDDTDALALATRALPQHVSRIGFAKAIANGVDTEFFAPAIIGAGQSVNQTGGNLVITTGTTARSETIIRSLASWKGGIRLRAKVTLSQRIINQNFFVELVDVIGDSLAYVINSATSITITIPNNTLTAQNIGQSISIGNFAGTGTFLSGRYTIASVSGNDVTFTVAGFAVGSGVCSLFGLSFYRLLYDGATPTTALYQNQRNGYANAAVSATINTTASPGHIAIITANDLVASFSDQPTASATGMVGNVRAQQWENVPDDKDLRLQIRVLNLGTAPASTTTFTVGFVSISNYANQDISIQDVRPISQQGLPVELVKTITQPVSGNVTATVASTTANIGTNGMSAFTDSITNLAISGSITSTSRDAGSTIAFARFVAKAIADQAGTLRIEQSTDNITFRRASADIPVSANIPAEVAVFVTARYHRVVYTNGGVAQTAFLLTSAYLRI